MSDHMLYLWNLLKQHDSGFMQKTVNDVPQLWLWSRFNLKTFQLGDD